MRKGHRQREGHDKAVIKTLLERLEDAKPKSRHYKDEMR
jgi:hypothetical protein